MRYLLVLLALSFDTYSLAQVSQEWIQQTMQEYSQREDIPSIVFALVDSTGVRLSAKMGTSNLETGTPIDEKSTYQIGSLSKLFTGIILKNLILEGKIDPEQAFAHYLGQDISPAINEKWANVKVIDLLHHRAGLPNHGPSTPPTPNGIAMRGEYTATQLLADLEEIPYQADHSEQVSYSNYAYGILAYIAEKVSGQSYPELLELYVKTPYQLQQTTTLPPAKDRLVTPYFIGKRSKATQYWEMGAETPAGGIFSTLTDLSQLLRQQLRVYQTEQRNDPLWLSPQVRPFDRAGYMSYGYGIMKNRSLFDSTSIKYEHGGDLDGFASQYKFFPQLGLGYVLLTSSGGPWFNELDALIEQKLLGVPPREIMALDKKELKAFEGTYRFDSGFELEIVRDGNQLKVLFPGNDPVNIYPASTQLLFFRHMNVQMTFERDQGGGIKKVSYIQNGQTFYPQKIK